MATSRSEDDLGPRDERAAADRAGHGENTLPTPLGSIAVRGRPNEAEMAALMTALLALRSPGEPLAGGAPGSSTWVGRARLANRRLGIPRPGGWRSAGRD